MDDFREYLLTTTRGEIPLYYLDGQLTGKIFLASVLLPRRQLRSQQLTKLSRWNFNPVEESWGWGYDFDSRGRKQYQLSKPFEWATPEIIRQAVPLLFHRKNECVKDGAHYFELNQQIAHVHGLHWMEDRSAYCTLDELGDIRDVVKVAMDSPRWVVTIAEDVLLKHLLVGDFVLVRFFDVDRGIWTSLPPIPQEKDFAATVYWDENDLHARWTPVRAESGTICRAFLRGFQLIRPPTDRKIGRALLEGSTSKQYCTYIAHDWKHDRIAEVSCDPKKLGNYFVPSRYPFEISPAFFRREVLLKDQSNRDKYIVQEGYITCHGTWSLRYDINERDQVHAYLKDLTYLPYAEQLHWKSYNESPKADISRRAYTTDFLGQFYTLDPEPLRDLKRLLSQFPSGQDPEGLAEIWRQPIAADADLMDHIHYMAGTSSQEWEAEIIALDKLVVEGLNREYLRRVAEALGVDSQKLREFGSISLLAEIAKARSVATDLFSAVIDPLRELQRLRSKFGSHRKGQEADQILKELRRQHRHLTSHHRQLVKEVSQAMLTLADLATHGYFNLPPVPIVPSNPQT